MPDGGKVKGVQSAVVELSQCSQQIQTAKHLVEEMRQWLLQARQTRRKTENIARVCEGVKIQKNKNNNKTTAGFKINFSSFLSVTDVVRGGSSWA